MTPIDFDLARWDLLGSSRPSIAYCREHGIQFEATVPACGGVLLAPVKFDRQHRFAPAPDGELAAWVDALDDDAETVVDSVAWPIGRPDRFARLSGVAPALGLSAARNPATFSLGFALNLYRNPLQWLQGRCHGAVLLDRRQGARWLLDLDAPRIAPVDRQHACAVVADMERLIDRRRFVVAEAA